MELHRGTRKDIVEGEIDRKDLDSRILQKNNISYNLFILYVIVINVY